MGRSDSRLRHVAVLALRARGYADAAPARTLLGWAVVGLVGLAVLTVASPDAPPRLVAVGVLLAVVVLEPPRAGA